VTTLDPRVMPLPLAKFALYSSNVNELLFAIEVPVSVKFEVSQLGLVVRQVQCATYTVAACVTVKLMYDELPGLVFLSSFAVMMNVAPLTLDGTAEVIVKLRSRYWRAFVAMPVGVVLQ